MKYARLIAGALMTQCILNAVSLPFLYWWHIPTPAMSLVGNLIHPPFLSATLLLSSFLFFATLLHLPTGPLPFLLTQTTSCWQWLLSLKVPALWIALSLPLLLTIFALAGIIIFHRFRTTPKTATSPLVVSSLILATGLWCSPSTHKVTVLHKRNASLVCVPHADSVIELCDNHYLSRCRNINAAIHYEILPHLLFTYAGGNKVVVSSDNKRARDVQRIINACL